MSRPDTHSASHPSPAACLHRKGEETTRISAMIAVMMMMTRSYTMCGGDDDGTDAS
jgi:hypothetical protein